MNAQELQDCPRSRMSTVVAASIAVLVATGHAYAAPLEVLENPAAAHALIPEGATCIPRSLGKMLENDEVELRLGTVSQRPVLCAIAKHGNAVGTVGTLGCFEVDLKARRLVARAPTLLPGVVIPTRLLNGCSHGLCASGTFADPESVDIALDDTETQLALIGATSGQDDYTAVLFDAATRTRLGTARYQLWAASSRDLFVAHQLITEEHAAGPTAGAFARPLENGENESTQVVDVNVDGGVISMVRPGHVLVAMFGGYEIAEWNASTHEARFLRKKRAPSCVTDDQTGRCPPSVARQEVALGNDLIAAPGGYLAVTRTQLIQLDARFRVKHRLSPMCAPVSPRSRRRPRRDRSARRRRTAAAGAVAPADRAARAPTAMATRCRCRAA
jgi:hypothetical protein